MAKASTTGNIPGDRSTSQRTADNLHKSTDRFADAAHRAVDTGAEYGQRAEENLREQGDRAARQWHDGQERVSAKGRELNNDLLIYLRDNPYKSLGIAVGVGYLLGAIWRK